MAHSRNINSLMHTAVCLTNQTSSGIHKLSRECSQEEIGLQNSFSSTKCLPCTLKVKVDIQRGQEACDRVRVLIRLHLHYAHDFIAMSANEHSCCCDIAKQPRAGYLDGIQISGGKCHVEECLRAIWYVFGDTNEERPMKKPRSGSEGRGGAGESGCGSGSRI